MCEEQKALIEFVKLCSRKATQIELRHAQLPPSMGSSPFLRNVRIPVFWKPMPAMKAKPERRFEFFFAQATLLRVVGQ
jgi:hypothetical protein